MLTALHIRNFAVIDEVELHFGAGMTVLTGETGAGKSIIVDALGLILGDRADSALLRAGAERCELSATFNITGNAPLQELLEEQAISGGDDELLIRRVINADGRSKAFVNGSQVALQTLKPMGELLIDIHGQHAHQSLLKRDAQRQLLDEQGDYAALLAEVADLYRQWRDVCQQLDNLAGLGEDREAKLELLRYQVQELQSLNPQPDEFEALDQEYTRLANASRLVEGAQSAYSRLADDDQAISVLAKRIERELRELGRYDERLIAVADLLDNSVIQLNEAGDELRHYLDRLELDPERLQQVEQRLSAMHDLARKHHIQPETLADHLQSLSEQLQQLEASDEHYAQLRDQQQKLLDQYHAACTRLHKERQKTAAALGQTVTEQIRELGMAGGEFVIDVQAETEARPSVHGQDRIDFLVSANPGQPPRPLAKVASGGELSRISLALQVRASDSSGAASMIFDEVDAGIGGGVAEIVGQLLRQIGEHHQVFCVTHLPQVASLGHAHLRVLKMTGDSETRTRVATLSAEERVEEIARMLGGLKITEQTRAHAREMLAG
ncbi:DNA repair protein RecN (Recombination protein N) [Methylohalomonas lacus]|uniref:DNA repair protein RecN n=1 Tax=Methylohalomonas lacus TaxID=398773 RepID=A0AAE3HJV1_9GAMM|nr:DNA repair protein RecN [Methylohalomonas lacus]MCS3903696.1 DNA repair protein RecN (Recombination protein N) [Methylohalomonas lacus]